MTHVYRHKETRDELDVFLSAITKEDAKTFTSKKRQKLMNEHYESWKLWCLARNYTISEILIGKPVSVDVSTCEENFDRRFYGTVLCAQEEPDGFVLLVQDAEANYDHLGEVRDAKIGAEVWKYIDRMSDHCPEDSAERIVDEFLKAVRPIMLAPKGEDGSSDT